MDLAGRLFPAAGDFTNGELDVALERTQVRPGETVRGYVELVVAEGSEGAACSGILVVFKGVAHSAVQYTERLQQYDAGVGNQGIYDYDQPLVEAGAGTGNRMATESRMVCCMQLPLAQFPDGIAAPGGYQFPFQLPVPEGIPASVAMVRGTGSMGHMVYTLSIQVLRPGHSTTSVPKEVPLDVVLPMPVAPCTAAGPQCSSDRQDVSFLCCINSGSITLAGRLAAGAFLVSEPFDMFWQLRNHSSTTVQKVNAKLVKNVLITARGRSKHTQTVVLDSVLMKGVKPGASPGHVESVGGDTASEHPPAAGMLQHKLTAPADAAPSAHVNGMLTISYAVVLEAETSCCASNPYVKLPVELCRQAPIPAAAWAAGGGPVTPVLGVPAAFQPDPSAKASPQPPPSTGWIVLDGSALQEPGGPLYEFAGFTAQGGADLFLN